MLEMLQKYMEFTPPGKPVPRTYQTSSNSMLVTDVIHMSLFLRSALLSLIPKCVNSGTMVLMPMGNRNATGKKLQNVKNSRKPNEGKKRERLIRKNRLNSLLNHHLKIYGKP